MSREKQLKDMTYDELYKLHVDKTNELAIYIEEIQIISDFMATKFEKGIKNG